MNDCLYMRSNRRKHYLFYQIIQVLLILFVPAMAMWVNRRFSALSFLSPIVICFAVGILVRNLNLIPIDEQISGITRDGTILFALPLLLFSSDVRDWLSHSKKTLSAFLLAVLSGAIATSVVAFFFHSSIENIWIPAGMMMGIHSGGTPNLFAVGIALEASDDVLTLTNSAQILWGAIYLLFLLSVGPKLIGSLLPRGTMDTEEHRDLSHYVDYKGIVLVDVAKALFITALIVGASAGLSFLIFKSLVPTFVIVFVTTIAIICSFSNQIRTLKGPFEVGDYLLLIFGVAVGMMSNFWALIAEGGQYIAFVGLIFILTVITQVFLSRIFSIDRDTFIISSTATIFGPVFIPQVAQVLKKRSLILGGIAISLLGLAIGNYAGLLLAYCLKLVLS